MRRQSFLLTILLTLVLIMPTAQAAAGVELSPFATDAGLTMTQVADQLAFPMGMAVLPDDSLLVATSPSATGNFYDSTGTLLRLADTDGDGSLDGQTILAENLPGSLVAVARSGEIVIATSAAYGNEQIMFFRRGSHWSGPLTLLTRITLSFKGAMHQSYGLAVRPDPADATAFDLFFNIGAAGNDIAGPSVQAGGAITDLLTSASIYMIRISDSGSALTFSPAELIATGLRNGTTIAIQPSTGDLWIGENGIDGMDIPTISFSADELDIVRSADIGQKVIDFGFPDHYIDYATGTPVGDQTQFVAFLPIDGSHSEGVAGITFVPASFPQAVAGGVLAGFHGQFDETGIANDENPLLWVDAKTGDRQVIVTNDSTAVGHLDSMTAGKD
ncbi:MAG TPA: hypothetical protein PK819_04810, partial [Thermomicrobiales bacterium]|nr:hypothetical protein [Thermomicrobiales bacterium]